MKTNVPILKTVAILDFNEQELTETFQGIIISGAPLALGVSSSK